MRRHNDGREVLSEHLFPDDRCATNGNGKLDCGEQQCRILLARTLLSHRREFGWIQDVIDAGPRMARQ
jgi:hypothetical protein